MYFILKFKYFVWIWSLKYFILKFKCYVWNYIYQWHNKLFDFFYIFMLIYNLCPCYSFLMLICWLSYINFLACTFTVKWLVIESLISFQVSIFLNFCYIWKPFGLRILICINLMLPSRLGETGNVVALLLFFIMPIVDYPR